MKKYLPFFMFLAAAAVAVFIVVKANLGGDRADTQTAASKLLTDPHEAAGRDDYSAPPKMDFIQRCDPLVIDAWRQLSGIHSRFLEKYNKATREERMKMQEEITNLFTWYDPDDTTVKDIKDDDSPANVAKKEIWQVGYKFEKAIKDSPANACNYVSFAVFLKPRNEARALECFEEGIKLWPANYAFHWLLADFLYRAPSSYGFTVFDVVHPQERRMEFKERIYSNLDLAEKFDPINGFIPIYRAQVMISLGEDAVEIYEQFVKAVEMEEYPSFLQPPPRPAKSLNWFTAGNAMTRTQDMHYDIETNYGFYLDKVIDRWYTQGGLREAAERKGPIVFVTAYRTLYRMGATDPFDRSFFYINNHIADVMKEYYKAHGMSDAAEATNGLIKTGDVIDAKIRSNCVTNKNWSARIPKGIDPLDTEKVSLMQLEMYIRRGNPALRDLVDDFNPRLVRECSTIVEKYPVEPDDGAKGKFWQPDKMIDATLESGFPKDVPFDPTEIPPNAQVEPNTQASDTNTGKQSGTE